MKRIVVFLLVFIQLLMATQVYLDRKVFPHDLIGTYYEVSIANGYRLVATNTDYGTIFDPVGATVVDCIDSVQVIGDAVIAKVASQYFLLRANTGRVSQYETSTQLQQDYSLEHAAFKTVIDHYWQHRRWTDILTTLACLVIALTCAYFIPPRRASN